MATIIGVRSSWASMYRSHGESLRLRDPEPDSVAAIIMISGHKAIRGGKRLGDNESGSSVSEQSGRRGRWPAWFAALVIVAFSVGTVANLAMEWNLAPVQRALLIRDGGALNKVVRTESETVRNRYWIASVVHDIARGGTLVVPAEGLASEARFELFSGVDIEVEGYNPELTQETVDSFDGFSSVTGYGNTIGSTEYFPFVVVWDATDSPVDVLRMWFFEDTMYLVDDRIMGSGGA